MKNDKKIIENFKIAYKKAAQSDNFFDETSSVLSEYKTKYPALINQFDDEMLNILSEIDGDYEERAHKSYYSINL